MFVIFNRTIGTWIVTVIAVMFGLLTIKSGGSVLFVDGAARQAAGNYVPFVLWFNFLAGFVYVFTGAGLWLQKQWAVRLSLVIVIATFIVYAILGLYILGGGLYEKRTIIAMGLRTIIWACIAIYAYRNMNRAQSIKRGQK